MSFIRWKCMGSRRFEFESSALTLYILSICRSSPLSLSRSTCSAFYSPAWNDGEINISANKKHFSIKSKSNYVWIIVLIFSGEKIGILTPICWPSTNSWGTCTSADCIRSRISCWYSLLMNISRSSNLTSSVRKICFTLAHLAYVSRTIPMLVE